MDRTNLVVKRASRLDVGIRIKFIGPEEIDALFKLGGGLLERRGSGASRLGGGHGNLCDEELKSSKETRSTEEEKRGNGGRGVKV